MAERSRGIKLLRHNVSSRESAAGRYTVAAVHARWVRSMPTLHTCPVTRAGRRHQAHFAGWSVVSAAFVVLFVVYGIQFSFGTFIDDIVTDTGWSENRIQLVFALYILGYSVLSAVSGTLTDRYGPRLVVGTGAVVLTTGYLVWATAPNLWFVLLGLGIIAPIGMSASWVPCNATVVRWFVERRGLALAIATAGGSLANIAVPPIAALVVDRVGWRTGLATMASVGGCIMLIAALRMIRDPESIGQHPDGAESQPTASSDDGGLAPVEAARTRAYWLVLAMYALSFSVVFVPFVHISQFATSLGVASVTAATTISAIGVGGLIGRLVAGPASDLLGRRRVVAAAFALETAAFVAIAAAPNLAVLYPAAIGFGLSYGATVTLLPALVGDYFGRAHSGAIVGRIFGTAGAMAAVGPYVAQLLVDTTDSYRFAFALAAGANGAVVAMSLLLPARRGSGQADATAKSATTAR